MALARHLFGASLILLASVSTPLLGGDCPPPAFLVEHHALMRAGRYSDAEKEARRLVADLTAQHGADSVPVAQALEGLALAISRSARPGVPEALEVARRALEIKEKRLGAEDPAVAGAHDHLGEVLENRGEHKDAMASHERALAIREKALGEDHPDVAESLYHLAVAAYFLDEDLKSRAALERSVTILEKTLGPDSPEVGRSLEFQGRQLSYFGKPAEARAVAEPSLRILERALGPDHPSLIFPLTTVARILGAAGEMESAVRTYRRAVEVVERALGPEHPDLMHPLRFHAYFAYETGDPQAGNVLMERRVRIAEISLDPSSTRLARILSDSAVAFWRAGDRVRCRPLFERAVGIMTKARDKDPAGYATVAQDLGLFLLYIGDYDAALPHLQGVVEVAERTLESEQYERVQALANLAFLYLKMDRFQDALPLAEKVVEIWSRKLAPNDSDLPRTINTLAGVVHGLGDQRRARALHERALSIWQKLPAPHHPDMALDLEGLGEISLREGKPETAKGYFERSVDLRQAVQGGEHPDVAVSLEGMARVEWVLGEPQRALDLALRSEAIGRSHLQAAARGFSEREALRYASIRPSGLDLALSVLASLRGAEIPAAAGRVWDQAIRSRAVILDEIGERHRVFASGETRETTELRSDVERARKRFAQLLVTGAGPGGVDKYDREVRTAQAERDRAERALAEKSPAFSESLTRSRAGLDEVRSALPRDGALVAYVLHRRLQGPTSSTPSYVAFVESPGAEGPKLVPIGTAGEIDALVQKWRDEIATRRADEAYKVAGDALRRAIWDPLEPHLKGAAQVFVVPDGALSLVNLGTLPVGGERYLVEIGPRVHYLSAERDLVRPARARQEGESLLVLGGPDYEAKPQVPSGGGRRTGSPTEGAPAATAIGRASMYRGATADCSALRQRRFEPLPAAWLEAREVGDLWRQKRSGGLATPRLLTGAGADERSFKRLAAEFSVIHLATHGFFAEGCAPSAARSPLLLSGLALAGANRRWERAADDTEEDGILTAEEITSLDLSRADWVVLSACETGLGKLEAGEGVLGLRRAFQIAGAGTLIMSLWPVEDAATRAWMKHLYEERLRGASTSEAVRSASVKVIEARRKAGKSTHPSTWGAFVAAGDWR